MPDRAEIDIIYDRLTSPDPRCDECRTPILEDGRCRFIVLRFNDCLSLLYLLCKQCKATNTRNISQDARGIRAHLISRSIW